MMPQAGTRATKSLAAASFSHIVGDITMLKATKAVAAAAGVMGVLAAGTVSADSLYTYHQGGIIEVMSPGRAVSFDVGSKHVIGYFYGKGKACHLAVVLADVDGGEQGFDSPGTRVVVPVVPGKRVQVDASNGQSAEFHCGPGASRMTARIVDRAPYKS